MSHSHDPANLRLVLVGDSETADQLDELAGAAAGRGAALIAVHAYEPAAARFADDLTHVEAAVLALSKAIAERACIWVPYPLQDLGREQHIRRLSLVLQRHGLNLLLGQTMTPCPIEGGLDIVDYALRAEVRSVDELDRAALAAGGITILSAE